MEGSDNESAQWPPLRPLRGLIRKRIKRGPQTPLDPDIYGLGTRKTTLNPGGSLLPCHYEKSARALILKLFYRFDVLSERLRPMLHDSLCWHCVIVPVPLTFRFSAGRARDRPLQPVARHHFIAPQIPV